jgi:hypothetical protein
LRHRLELLVQLLEVCLVTHECGVDTVPTARPLAPSPHIVQAAVALICVDAGFVNCLAIGHHLWHLVTTNPVASDRGFKKLPRPSKGHGQGRGGSDRQSGQTRYFAAPIVRKQKFFPATLQIPAQVI